MDRFEFGVIQDPQEAKSIHNCTITGGDIYEGEPYLLTTDGDILMNDLEVLMTYYHVTRLFAGKESID